MERMLSRSACLMALIALGSDVAVVSAQEAAASATTPPAAANAVDSASVAALEKMGAALRKLSQYGVTSDTTTELVLEDGQKVQLDGEVAYKVREPGMLFGEVRSDRRHRQFFYDGKDFTLWSPRLKFYATIPGVDATLRELGTRLAERHSVELPLLDLFLWGTPQADKSVLTSAMYIGPGTIDGAQVDHHAFRQPGSDWQVWIDKTTQLPRKLVITSMDDPERPQYTARLRWQPNATFDDATFRFRPPEGATRIAIADAQATAAAEEK